MHMSKVMRVFIPHFLRYKIAISYDHPVHTTPVNLKTYPGRRVVASQVSQGGSGALRLTEAMLLLLGQFAPAV
jgi:hypothetical protein